MEHCRYVDLCFHASSLPCLHTFWHAIPTAFYISNLYFVDVNLTKFKNILSGALVTTTPEIETALTV